MWKVTITIYPLILFSCPSKIFFFCRLPEYGSTELCMDQQAKVGIKMCLDWQYSQSKIQRFHLWNWVTPYISLTTPIPQGESQAAGAPGRSNWSAPPRRPPSSPPHPGFHLGHKSSIINLSSLLLPHHIQDQADLHHNLHPRPCPTLSASAKPVVSATLFYLALLEAQDTIGRQNFEWLAFAPSNMDTKKIPPFWTGCPCRLRENWAGSSGAGFDMMGTVPSTKNAWAPKTPVFFSWWAPYPVLNTAGHLDLLTWWARYLVQ